MLTDTTREEWMRGWSEGAFDVRILKRAEAMAYLRIAMASMSAHKFGPSEYGYVAALSAALGVI